MFRAGPSPDPIESLSLEDTDAGARALVAPARGGLVTRWRVEGRELLFLDQATLADPTRNVRGGIPVLFPTPGKLERDEWARSCRAGKLPQHGFARTLPWELVATSSDGAASCRLRLAASEATRSHFPWSFALEHELALHGRTLRIEQRVTNLDHAALPFALGFHPYFLVPQGEKAAARIATRATRAYDNVRKREIPFAGFELTAPEVDLHLIDHGSSAASLELASGTIRIECSPAYQRWVVWTLAGRDFVCLEPWTAPANAMNTGEGLLRLAPGGTCESYVELTFAPR
ncbi:MAG: galactose mutarotase [Sorangiineae bacterium]|nr:galactose mutarotase [Polyangiaceae bacterium]MEB2321794.1 galactose mutarotase [Sorangiineae bacterium]